MLHYFLKAISYIFHPLFIPFVGVCFFYHVNPTYVPQEIMQKKILATFILSVLIPFLFFALLRTIGKASSVMLDNVNERRIPLMVSMILTFLIARWIFYDFDSTVLYYFFIGILFSSMLCYLLSLIGFKASVHMMAVTGLTVFFTALSINFQTNIYLILTLLLFLNGAVASSRLHLKAHTPIELVIGSIVGTAPQFILIFYWFNPIS